MKFLRPNILCENLLIIDGLSGSGKSILAPVLSSFKRVEKWRELPVLDQLCIYNTQKNSPNYDTSVIIQLLCDIALYNNMISREVNLRPFDDSGIFNNPYAFKYFKRLFSSGGDDVISEIQDNEIILNILSQSIFHSSNILFETFKKNISFIIAVRHPLYMVEHQYSYIERFGVDKREFTLTTGDKGTIPWFVSNVEGYSDMNSMDKVIHVINALTLMYEVSLNELDVESRKQVQFIPFESFVLDPYPWVKKCELLLRTQITRYTKKVLTKQKCPRTFIQAGKGHKSYGFNSKETKLTEKEDYNRRLELVKKEATPETIKILNNISLKYAKQYDFPRAMPWEV
jgi:hypothetical protein